MTHAPHIPLCGHADLFIAELHGRTPEHVDAVWQVERMRCAAKAARQEHLGVCMTCPQRPPVSKRSWPLSPPLLQALGLRPAASPGRVGSGRTSSKAGVWMRRLLPARRPQPSQQRHPHTQPSLRSRLQRWRGATWLGCQALLPNGKAWRRRLHLQRPQQQRRALWTPLLRPQGRRRKQRLTSVQHNDLAHAPCTRPAKPRRLHRSLWMRGP